ncbi:hypothetical protein IU459_21940 [Nocardia amamiensis]|uniref:DUF1109 domain-containing protein n=1 Tax=Nocardia amamiensis TaxID=404578 RepID=A0ABS0CUA6_9NOCA|nr:hypothetical protein [Nocardia amamiensis]MBF6300184.1 hypothetical protein [Nocardia amamiensis]
MKTASPVRRRTPRWFVLWMGLLTACIAVCCAALFWQLAAQGTFPTLVVLWVVLGVLGGIATLFGLLGMLRYRAYFYSLASPVLIAVLAGLTWYGIPQSTGWKLSRGILEDQAADCVNPGQRARLGLYTITFITPRDGGCLFYTQAGESNSEGFAYFRDPATPPHLGPPAIDGIEYAAFDRQWYRFVDDH